MSYIHKWVRDREHHKCEEHNTMMSNYETTLPHLSVHSIQL